MIIRLSMRTNGRVAGSRLADPGLYRVLALWDYFTLLLSKFRKYLSLYILLLIEHLYPTLVILHSAFSVPTHNFYFKICELVTSTPTYTLLEKYPNLCFCKNLVNFN
jgi:hypothetical protein